MELSKKGCLINAAVGGWYPRGTDRLVRSMIYHGWKYDILTWKDEPINEYYQPGNPYTIKAAALAEAMRRGYTHILWMDCSLWVTEDPNVLMQQIDAEGGLFIRSGYNLAQTSADEDLLFASMTRDQAELLPELWSCIFGINLETKQGRSFTFIFLEAAKAGVFNTPRTHSNMSTDERFLHARQDQTAATIAYHLSGYENLMEPGKILTNYTEREKNPDAIVFMQGM